MEIEIIKEDRSYSFILNHPPLKGGNIAIVAEDERFDCLKDSCCCISLESKVIWIKFFCCFSGRARNLEKYWSIFESSCRRLWINWVTDMGEGYANCFSLNPKILGKFA